MLYYALWGPKREIEKKKEIINLHTETNKLSYLAYLEK
jgi:hypothetical protein